MSAITNTSTMLGIPVPLEYTDAVSHNIMRDPVLVVPTGRTYDKATIDNMKAKDCQMMDPLDRTPIVYTSPNVNLKESIQRFLVEHPELKGCLEPEKNSEESVDDSLYYTADEFAMIFVRHATYSFPANTEVRLYNCSRRLVYLAEAARQTNETLLLDPFLDILNDALLPFALRIKNLNAEGLLTLNYCISDVSKKNYISMKVTKKLEIETDNGRLITSPKNLFTRMIDSKLDRVTINPKQSLVLVHLNKFEHKLLSTQNNIYDLKNILFSTLLSYLSWDYSLEIEINGSLQIDYGIDEEIRRYFTLRCDEGTIVISLQKSVS